MSPVRGTFAYAIYIGCICLIKKLRLRFAFALYSRLVIKVYFAICKIICYDCGRNVLKESKSLCATQTHRARAKLFAFFPKVAFVPVSVPLSVPSSGCLVSKEITLTEVWLNTLQTGATQ